jgi:hypothetical protein
MITAIMAKVELCVMSAAAARTMLPRTTSTAAQQIPVAHQEAPDLLCGTDKSGLTGLSSGAERGAASMELVTPAGRVGAGRSGVSGRFSVAMSSTKARGTSVALATSRGWYPRRSIDAATPILMLGW